MPTTASDQMSQPNDAEKPRRQFRDRAAMALVSALMLLPFRTRSRVAGWFGRNLLGRVALTKRMLPAIAHFRPDLTEQEVARIARQAPGNLARMIIEILSARDMARIAAKAPVTGPGLNALTQAHAENRPVILVSAHFGNYDAWRLNLISRGFSLGGYFKELGNPALNARYVEAVSASGQPMFPDTGEGRKSMIRFLRGGGMLGILVDLDRPNGVLIDFFGKPTRTVLSMAQMALKYDALLVPIYGIRTDDQAGFLIEIEAPIPHSDAETMTQAVNNSFEAQVRAHPEQWVWWHNRRKWDHPDV